MTSLNLLPRELIDQICEFLYADSIAALTATSSHQQTRTTPSLYRQVNVTQKSGPPARSTLSLLLRSILGKPELALFIENLKMKIHGPESRAQSRTAVPLAIRGDRSAVSPVQVGVWKSDEYRRACNTIQALPMSEVDQEVWIRSLERSENDAVIALLVIKLKRVKTLDIDNDDIRLELLDEALELVSFHRTHVLLETIRISSQNEEQQAINVRMCPVVFLNALATLPSLKSLNVTVPFPRPYHYLSESRPPRPSNWPQSFWPQSALVSSLRRLVLRHPKHFDFQLGAILYATPQLEHLEYRAVYEFTDPTFVTDIEFRDAADYNSIVYECDELMASLRHVRQSLRCLIISITWMDFDHEENSWAYVDQIIGLLHGLQTFERLERLNVPHSLILGECGMIEYQTRPEAEPLQSILPPNLHQLTLTDETCGPCDFDMWSAELLADIIQRYVPMMAKVVTAETTPSITIHTTFNDERWTEDDKRKLSSFCIAAGVHCHFTGCENDRLVRSDWGPS